jgi:hypothetical protein
MCLIFYVKVDEADSSETFYRNARNHIPKDSKLLSALNQTRLRIPLMGSVCAVVLSSKIYIKEKILWKKCQSPPKRLLYITTKKN